jgi:hypothetical protein
VNQWQSNVKFVQRSFELRNTKSPAFEHKSTGRSCSNRGGFRGSDWRLLLQATHGRWGFAACRISRAQARHSGSRPSGCCFRMGKLRSGCCSPHRWHTFRSCGLALDFFADVFWDFGAAFTAAAAICMCTSVDTIAERNLLPNISWALFHAVPAHQLRDVSCSH